MGEGVRVGTRLITWKIFHQKFSIEQMENIVQNICSTQINSFSFYFRVAIIGNSHCSTSDLRDFLLKCCVICSKMSNLKL